MKKLFIPFKYQKGIIGGPNTFSKNLIDKMNKNKYPYQTNSLFAKSIFFPIRTNFKNIAKVKLFGGTVIQRLDGCYFSNKKGDPLTYHDKNREFEEIYKNYADHVVFQSEYSRDQIFQVIGKIPKDKYSIIYNGANTDIFYPNNEEKSTEKITFISIGNFRHSVMIMPSIDALDILYESNKNIEFKIIGKINLSNEQEIIKRPYVTNKVIYDQEILANELRNSDILLFPSYNAPCPNAVIEAICCGLPVIGYDSGSMKELVFFNRDLLVDMTEDIIHDVSKYDAIKYYNKINILINNFSKYKKKSLDFSKYYSMDKCLDKYIDVFEKDIKRNSLTADLILSINAFKFYKKLKKINKDNKKKIG